MHALRPDVLFGVFAGGRACIALQKALTSAVAQLAFGTIRSLRCLSLAWPPGSFCRTDGCVAGCPSELSSEHAYISGMWSFNIARCLKQTNTNTIGSQGFRQWIAQGAVVETGSSHTLLRHSAYGHVALFLPHLFVCARGQCKAPNPRRSPRAGRFSPWPVHAKLRSLLHVMAKNAGFSTQ